MTPSPFSAGNQAASRGGIIDLPTPKRAANIYVGKRAAPMSEADLSALEITSDSELPALLGDLGLDEVMDPALLALESAGARSTPSVLALDLRDLPAPVGPRPRSPLSTRAAASAVSASRSMLPVSRPGPTSKPGTEPEPLPAPPMREALHGLGETVLPVPLAEAKRVSRPESIPGRPPLAEVLPPPPVSERPTVPGVTFPHSLRDTMPVPRRASPSGTLGVVNQIPPQFDISEPVPLAPRAAEATPPMQPLPALPSDESGGAPPSPTTISASASISDSSGPSLITGGPGTSSTATSEPRPLRMGYLLVVLAVLALLLAVIIARIAGVWNKQAAPITEPHSSAPSGSPEHRPPF